MMYSVCFLVLLLIATRATSEQQKVVERFEEHAIVPSIITPSPPVCLIVKYSGNFTVKLGNELRPLNAKEAPCNVTWPVKSDSLYTLMMVDPDAPSRKTPLVGQVLHWLQINIQNPSKISEGEEIVSYLGNINTFCKFSLFLINFSIKVLDHRKVQGCTDTSFWLSNNQED